MFRELLKKGEDSNLPLQVVDPLGSTVANLFAEPSAPITLSPQLGWPVLWGGLHWEVPGNHWTESPLLPVPLELVCFP